MNDNVRSFPNWKTYNCSASDKLRELAEYAERHPEDVRDVVLVWMGEDDTVRVATNSEIRTKDSIFILEYAKTALLNEIMKAT